MDYRDKYEDSFRSYLFLFLFGLFVPISEFISDYYGLRAKSNLIFTDLLGISILLIYLLLVTKETFSKYYLIAIRTLYVIYLVYTTYSIGDIYNPDNMIATAKIMEFVVVLFVGLYIFYSFQKFYVFASIFFIFFLGITNYFDYDFKLNIIVFLVLAVLITINYIRHISENNININYYRSLNIVNTKYIYVASVAPNGDIEYINQSFEKLFGSLEHIKKYKWDEFEAIDNIGKNVIQKTLKNDKIIYIEWRTGEKVGVNTLHYGVNITERHLLELELNKSKLWMQSLIKNSGDIMVIADSNLIIKECYFNERYNKIVNLEAILNKSIKRVELTKRIQLSKENYDLLEEKVIEAINTNTDINYESITLNNGKESYHSIKISPIYTPNSASEFVLIIFTLTDKLKIENESPVYKPLYDAFIKNTNLLIYCKNEQNNFQFVNDNFANFYGKEAYEIVNSNESKIDSKIDETYLENEAKQLLENKGKYTSEEVRKNIQDTDTFFEIIKVLIPTEADKFLILGMINDVTNQRNYEKEKNRKLEIQQRTGFTKDLKITNYQQSIKAAFEFIDELIASEKPAPKAQLIQIQRKLSDAIDEEQNTWKDFKISFEDTNPLFFDKLTAVCPDLSKSELKHCAYIIANLNAKAVSKMLNMNIRSIQTIRYRIKKKFKLEPEENLFDFLIQYQDK